ncbi:MAG TPA: hypothetical protein VK539_26470 [Myxococcaceae bacterium]|nr:hypothetical protein [Myxococcaceae bacterium]
MFYRVAQQLAVCLGLTLVVGLSSGCQKGGEPSAEPPQPKLATPEGAPFDVDAVMRQVHFAYRQEEDGWRGQHATYEVAARPEGLVLTPVRYTELSEPPLRTPRARGLEELAPRVQAERGAPLKLGAAQLTRGSVSLSTSRPRGQVQADGHLTFVHEALVEHLRNSEQGVEQSWSFRRWPPTARTSSSPGWTGATPAAGISTARAWPAMARWWT